MADFDKNLELKKKNSWQYMSDDTKADVFALCEDYKKFLDTCKTEREAVREAVKMLRACGFISLEEAQKACFGKDELAGRKLYYVHHDKAIFISILGKNGPELGLNIIGAHVDNPRLDLRPNPMMENSNLLYFKTHYYGGIKCYQWPTIPLALHGVIVKNDGTKVDVCVGEDDSDPKFMISDLLIHLSHELMEKPASKVTDPEQLNVLIGSIPGKIDESSEDDKALTVKQNVLTFLFEKYGICEKNFGSAELSIVPAAKASDIGFDRGLIAGYGHDDRVCAYTELRAFLDFNGTPEKTAVAYFSDKEEIGSMGITGARSNALELFAMELCALYGTSDAYLSTKRALSRSKMISADVTAAYDPAFSDVYEEHNCARMAHGIAIEKYTGSGGKYNASDASAEYVHEVTSRFTRGGAFWQLTEMGKIGRGGGGTIAQYMADKGVEVIDCGVPLFSMHAPMEIASKADIYWAYKAYLAFING